MTATTSRKAIIHGDMTLDEFRAAVRAWLESAVPRDWPERMAHADERGYCEFQRWWLTERARAGLAVPHWPLEYGGANLSLRHQIVLAEESARANAPPTLLHIVSLSHMAATLLAWGTELQKRRYLGGAARGEVWCQGFSEPNAGSDLASLRTRAVRHGDHYIVNGHKIWSTQSMYADYCLLLARTTPDTSGRVGLSYLIMDMRSPGIDVRSIRQLNGRADFGEIFLVDVQVPIANLLGEENKGWEVAQSTLAAERGILALEEVERLRYSFERIYKDGLDAGRGWLKDPEYRRSFMRKLAELQALRRMMRNLVNTPGDARSIDPAVIKIIWTTLIQQFSELQLHADGLRSQYFERGTGSVTDPCMYQYLTSFGFTIAGGSNEIMRNIIAERGIGLPRR